MVAKKGFYYLSGYAIEPVALDNCFPKIFCSQQLLINGEGFSTHIWSVNILL